MSDPKPSQSRSKGEGQIATSIESEGLGMCGNCRLVDEIEKFPVQTGPFAGWLKCPRCGFLLCEVDAPEVAQ